MSNLHHYIFICLLLLCPFCAIFTIFFIIKSKRKKKNFWATNPIFKIVLLIGNIPVVIFLAHILWTIVTLPAPNLDAQIAYYSKKYRSNFDVEMTLKELSSKQKMPYLCDYSFFDTYVTYCGFVERIKSEVLGFTPIVMYLTFLQFYFFLFAGIIIIQFILKKFSHKFPPGFQKYIK